MSHEPTPRHIAHAIADLAHSLCVDSWRYLDTWEILEAGGVPAAQRRDVMDCAELVSTEALETMRQWVEDGERGALVLHGAQDTGKSVAAAQWALDRHRAGRATMWISAATWGRLTFDQIRPLLRAAESAEALVVDDAGCGGSQGEHFRRTIEALLLERDQRPTMVTGNLNSAEMDAWLGERILSRLGVAGAKVWLETSLEMRQRDLEVVAHLTGRGEAWDRAAALVGVFGCERGSEAVTITEYDDEGGSWEHPTGEYIERFDVGRELEVRVTRARSDKDARAACMRATKLAGLDDRKVWARAVELVGTVSDLDSCTVLEQVTARLAAQLTDMEQAKAAGRRADNEYRSKICYDTLEGMVSRNRSMSRVVARNPNDAPAWTHGPAGIKAMQGQGYFVRGRSSGWSLYRKRKGSADQLVVPMCATVADAWQACRLLWGSGW